MACKPCWLAYLACMKHLYSVFCLVLLAMGASAQVSMNVDLLFNWNDTTIPGNGSGATYNETWGFVQDGEEYAVIGSTYGTHIFHVNANDELVEVDRVPGLFQNPVVHRDFHDHNGYLYGICQQGGSSLQIMDLQYLPDSVDLVYDSDTLFPVAHNVFIDTATSKLYVCGPPMHAMSIYDISNPIEPELISHFDEITYVHDCFVRNDSAYLNGANEGLYVYDMSTASNPQILGSLDSYPDQGYNHSGWLSKDGNIYVMADETLGKRMKVVDASDLTDITPQGLFNSGVDSSTVPHNLMIENNIVYVSHYNDGLRIFDVSDPAIPQQVGYYDTHLLPDTSSRFRGAWGIYSFLPSGRLLISDRQEGLYLFRFNNPNSVIEIPSVPDFLIYPNPSNGDFTLGIGQELNGEDLDVFDLRGRRVLRVNAISAGTHSISLQGVAAGSYVVRIGSTSKRLEVR